MSKQIAQPPITNYFLFARIYAAKFNHGHAQAIAEDTISALSKLNFDHPDPRQQLINIRAAVVRAVNRRVKQ